MLESMLKLVGVAPVAEYERLREKLSAVRRTLELGPLDGRYDSQLAALFAQQLRVSKRTLPWRVIGVSAKTNTVRFEPGAGGGIIAGMYFSITRGMDREKCCAQPGDICEESTLVRLTNVKVYATDNPLQFNVDVSEPDATDVGHPVEFERYIALLRVMCDEDEH